MILIGPLRVRRRRASNSKRIRVFGAEGVLGTSRGLRQVEARRRYFRIGPAILSPVHGATRRAEPLTPAQLRTENRTGFDRRTSR